MVTNLALPPVVSNLTSRLVEAVVLLRRVSTAAGVKSNTPTKVWANLAYRVSPDAEASVEANMVVGLPVAG